jgi:hypothetical protein
VWQQPRQSHAADRTPLGTVDGGMLGVVPHNKYDSQITNLLPADINKSRRQQEIGSGVHWGGGTATVRPPILFTCTQGKGYVNFVSHVYRIKAEKAELYSTYTIPVRTSQETRHVSTTEPNRLMLCGETVAVCCENRTEHTDTLWAVRTSQETLIHCVGRTRNFSMHVAHEECRVLGC